MKVGPSASGTSASVPSIRLRRGRRTDYEALAALCGWPEVDRSPRRSIRLYRNVVSDLAYDLYLADEDGSAVGMIAVSYVRVLGLGGQRATLEEIMVRPDRRGTGIGRRLGEFALRRAAKRGVRAFEAHPPNESAKQFLDRAGFHAVGSRYERPLGEEPTK